MAHTLGYFPGWFLLPATFAMFPIERQEVNEWPLNGALNAIINRKVNDCHLQEFPFLHFALPCLNGTLIRNMSA